MDGDENASSPLQLLLEVQAHDLALDRLDYRRRELPERARLRELDAAGTEVRSRREALEARRSELGRQQDELESRVDALTSRIGTIDARLRSGAAGSYRDQEAMANETRSLDGQRRGYEDRELEIMEQLEPVDQELAAVVAEAEGLESERSSVAELLAEEEAAIAEERAAVLSEREPLALRLPPDLAQSYERLRTKLGGIGAAQLVDGACSGCHLRLPARELDAVLHAPAGTVIYCDQCGRILVP
jgi:uncharacterized protein